jgi:hypothetical protein
MMFMIVALATRDAEIERLKASQDSNRETTSEPRKRWA